MNFLDLPGGRLYYYYEEAEEEDDNRKWWHYVTWQGPNDLRHVRALDYTPYGIPDLETLRLFCVLGFPDRSYCALMGVSDGASPVTKEQLKALYEAHRSPDALR